MNQDNSSYNNNAKSPQIRSESEQRRAPVHHRIHGIHQSTPQGVEAQQAPNPDRLSKLSLPRPCGDMRQESTPHHGLTSEGDGTDYMEPSWAKSKSGQKRVPVHGISQPHDILGADSDSKDSSQHHLRHCSHYTGLDDEDSCHLGDNK